MIQKVQKSCATYIVRFYSTAEYCATLAIQVAQQQQQQQQQQQPLYQMQKS